MWSLVWSKTEEGFLLGRTMEAQELWDLSTVETLITCLNMHEGGIFSSATTCPPRSLNLERKSGIARCMSLERELYGWKRLADVERILIGSIAKMAF